MKDHINAPNLTLEETFLRIAMFTTPYGCEAWSWHMIPGFLVKDSCDNISVLIRQEDGSLPTVMFTSHLDTACNKNEKVKFVFTINPRGDKIISTNGKTILGADDKIGAALMIKMIHAKVPGWYMFFTGEERGCIGSTHLSNRPEDWAVPYNQVKQCVSFDRYGYSDIITHQSFSRCCSDAYARALADRLQIKYRPTMGPSSEGLYTDSSQFMDLIPECTNISVGYDNHHTCKEWLNITFAEQLLRKLIKCNWETLPIKRDPSDTTEDWDHYYYGRNYYKTQSYKKDLEDEVPFNTNNNTDKDFVVIICDQCRRANIKSEPDFYCSDVLLCENPACGYPLDPNGTVFSSDELTEDEIDLLRHSNDIY